MNLEVDHYCFACGSENPVGLKMTFNYSDQGVTAEFISAREHQGFVQVVHGGIISTLLDEVMAHAVIAKGYRAVTARLELSFKKPTVIGEKVLINGKISSIKGRLIKTSAEIEQNGVITATATADFLILRDKTQ